MRLEHRSLLAHPPGFRPFRGTDLFERIGGQPTADKLVDLLYEGIEDDDQLRDLAVRARKRQPTRKSRQSVTLIGWVCRTCVT
jgi:truncated hemoglobin YjbI